VVVLVDQTVKFLIKLNLNPYDEVAVIGNWFSINFIENKGAAFGLTIADLSSKLGLPMDEETAKVLLTLFSIAAVLVIVYFLGKVKGHTTLLPFSLALILGGALGNIVDRVFYGVWFAGINDYEGGLFHGRVVDMFYMDLYQGQVAGVEVSLWPVFNLADFAITVGILMVIFFNRKFFNDIGSTKPAQEIPDNPSMDPDPHP